MGRNGSFMTRCGPQMNWLIRGYRRERLGTWPVGIARSGSRADNGARWQCIEILTGRFRRAKRTVPESDRADPLTLPRSLTHHRPRVTHSVATEAVAQNPSTESRPHKRNAHVRKLENR